MRLAFASTDRASIEEGGSGGELRAALGAARRKNGTAGAGTHTKAETVGLRALAVVRLERSLAHVSISVVVSSQARAERYEVSTEAGKVSGQPKTTASQLIKTTACWSTRSNRSTQIH